MSLTGSAWGTGTATLATTGATTVLVVLAVALTGSLAGTFAGTLTDAVTGALLGSVTAVVGVAAEGFKLFVYFGLKGATFTFKLDCIGAGVFWLAMVGVTFLSGISTF